MKKNLRLLSIIICGIILLQSCAKIGAGIKIITLNETIQSGSIYTLDMSAYGSNASTIIIAKQATLFTISQIDLDPATAKNLYRFSSDGKLNENESVTISVNAKDAGRCERDGNKTAITINFTIVQ